ncbi:hypothetical protein CRENBAI_006697 [Crenichthys baileyi]|uniref:Uncharacterized protein n=1 Tax=Crenichthys baileyi TaxID=28760 RepID=A0AAV9QRU0_9TELE
MKVLERLLLTKVTKQVTRPDAHNSPEKTKNNPNRAGGGGLGRRARDKNQNKVQAGDQEVSPCRHKVQAGDQDVAPSQAQSSGGRQDLQQRVLGGRRRSGGRQRHRDRRDLGGRRRRN